MAAGSTPVSAGSAQLPKRLIATGWDSPDTTQFRRDLRAMEKLPFDGVILYAQGRTGDGGRFDARLAFGTNHWERSFFTQALADLKAAHSERLTDNFLLLWTNPGNVDWFDDAGWNEVAEHWRLLAWLAREGGLKGLVFDPEPYTEPFKQFQFPAQARKGQHTYEDYCGKARERGREVMRAVSAEFPNAVLFAYFLLGHCARDAANGYGLRIELERGRYGLLPAFANGLLEVLPPGAAVVDGNEDAYLYNSEAEFNAAFVRIRQECLALVSAENRLKYRAQVQVGQGIYLDAYVNPASSRWYVNGLGGPRVDRLEKNVASALRTADEYVWVYGEHARWWPPRQPGEKAPPTWRQVLAGADSALWRAKDPAEWARRKLASLLQRGQLTNLAVNGDFAAARNGQPESWVPWQEKGVSQGQLSQDPEVGAAGKGSACLSGVQNGCFRQEIKASPGQRFIICARVRQSGAGGGWVMARWKTWLGMWTALDHDVKFAAPAEVDASGWSQISGTATVPLGAGRLVILLGAAGQRRHSDQVWFDGVAVVLAAD